MTKQTGLLWATMALLGAVLSVAWLAAALAQGTGTGNDPRIEALFVSGTLPISDTHPGAGVTKTVYVDDSAGGVLTLTFDVLGTPPLTLTAGAAFGVPARVLTSPVASWSGAVITYAVPAGAGSAFGVPYTLTNGGAQTTTVVALDVVRDVVAPVAPALLGPPDGTLTRTTALTLSWAPAADGAGSGVAGYTVDLGGALHPVTATFSAAVLPGDGAYTWTVRAVDYLGHASEYTGSWTFVVDVTPPESAAVAPPRVATGTVPVTWTASDTWSEVISTTLWYKKGAGDWTPYVTRMADAGTFDFDPPVGEGLYLFATTAEDRLGNVEAAPTVSETETYVGPFRLFLPLAVRDYRPLANGDFEAGLAGWQTGRGPFAGHGSGMPQTAVRFDGSQRALLGDPAAANGAIRVGYGYVAQTFTVDAPLLQLQYRVLSYDIVKGDTHYYDTFEVSVDRPPDQVTDAQRDARGCTSTALNPSGTRVVTDAGLVFCGGRAGTSADVGTVWDLGWRTVTLDLSAFEGQNVTLYFAIWSREYNAAFYNDQAWYNTWAYVDNVTLGE
ncbi:MAG: hypothetical protein JXD18_02495 [Anaerolineae bacterium]|nr:hypothetical protein [Anaerolineae bacterium]